MHTTNKCSEYKTKMVLFNWLFSHVYFGLLFFFVNTVLFKLECYLYTFLNFIVDIFRDSLSLLLLIWCASIVNELKMLKLQSLASRHWQRRRRRWIFGRFVCVLSIFFATTRPGYFYVLCVFHSENSFCTISTNTLLWLSHY